MTLQHTVKAECHPHPGPPPSRGRKLPVTGNETLGLPRFSSN